MIERVLQNLIDNAERYTASGGAVVLTMSGLALAVVKRILHLHGSVVRVHSAFKHGTRFELLLSQAG